jgi:hypothetical protein
MAASVADQRIEQKQSPVLHEDTGLSASQRDEA